MTDRQETTLARAETADALRRSEVAAAIRQERLIVVLRRVAPQSALIAIVRELADAGARVFEVTFDAPTAAGDLVACRDALGHGGGILVGAGTIRSGATVEAAVAAGAAFGVTPRLRSRNPLTPRSNAACRSFPARSARPRSRPPGEPGRRS